MVDPHKRLSRINFYAASFFPGLEICFRILISHWRSSIDTVVAIVLFLLVLEAALLPAESASHTTQREFDKQGFGRQFNQQKMDETLKQLGELLLGSVPTVILLAVLYACYTFLVYRPLTAVLAERRNRTEGALEKARADIAAAEGRTADYEQRLREARQKIFKSQEARRQQGMRARVQAVNEARSRGQEQVKQARAALEEDKQQAMAKLQADAARLANDIVRAVLRPVASPSQVGGQ